MILADLHTHTKYSHGGNSPAEMYAAAQARGFEIIGFTEHSPRPLGFDYTNEYRDKLTRHLPDYAREVLEIKAANEERRLERERQAAEKAEQDRVERERQAEEDAKQDALDRQAAEQGDAKAQFNLGVMYYHGKGVPQNDLQAVAWYRKAAEQGDVDAQRILGMMYDNGVGVVQDNKLAYVWSSVSAANGDVEAATNRDLFAKRLSPAVLAEAQALAGQYVELYQPKQ